MELLTATGKLIFFLKLEMFDMCTTGDTAYIDTMFKFLSVLLAQTPSFSKLFIPRTNSLVCRRVLCVISTKCTLHSNHRPAREIF
jgi:hypothetical protein